MENDGYTLVDETTDQDKEYGLKIITLFSPKGKAVYSWSKQPTKKDVEEIKLAYKKYIEGPPIE